MTCETDRGAISVSVFSAVMSLVAIGIVVWRVRMRKD